MMRRRTFLASIGAAGLLAASCGSDDPVSGEPLNLALLFSPAVLAAGRPERLSFGVMEQSGTLATGVGGEVSVQVLSGTTAITDLRVPGRVVAHEHPDGQDVHNHDSVVRYFTFKSTFPVPGSYTLRVDWQGRIAEVSLPVRTAADIGIPGSGDPMPQVSTPTLTDTGGVDPICTRRPPCSFHEVDHAQVVGTGPPVALLVATPSYCQTAFCGPVLDVMIDASPDFPDITFIHAEVYANPTEVGGLASPDLRTAPVMDDLGLTFEPTLFLIDGGGTVRDRIDNVFDEVELSEALSNLV